MIGVLAVIAILAALLIPKIFAAINNAKLNSSAGACATVKTAIADHYGKFGGLQTDGRLTPAATLTPIPNGAYDQVLLGEGFLDKAFAVKIGDGARMSTNLATAGTGIVLGTSGTATTATAPTAPTTATGTGAETAFDLDGDIVATKENDTVGSYVVYAVISGVTLADARDFNRLIDGTSTELGEGGTGGVTTDATASDIRGRVKYTFEAATATVYVHLTHR
jgi:type II secretory pathway pseudopilin PulG